MKQNHYRRVLFSLMLCITIFSSLARCVTPENEQEKDQRKKTDSLIKQLYERPQRRDTDELMQELKHWDPKVRWDAIKELGHDPITMAVEPLLEALLDSNEVVRWEARAALLEFADSKEKAVLEQFKKRLTDFKPIDTSEKFSRHLKLGALLFVLGDDPTSELSSALKLRPNDLFTHLLLADEEARNGRLRIATSKKCLKLMEITKFDFEDEITQSNFKTALLEARKLYGMSKMVHLLLEFIIKNTLLKVLTGESINQDAFDKVSESLLEGKKSFAGTATIIENKVKSFYPQLKFSLDEDYAFLKADTLAAERRKEAAIMLRKFRSEEVSVALSNAYESESNKAVRNEIMESLIRVDSLKALGILIAELNKADEKTSERREEAAIILRKFRSEEVSVALSNAYESESSKSVQNEIMESLIRVDSLKALDLLITELNKSDDFFAPVPDDLIKKIATNDLIKRIATIGGQKACEALIKKGDRLKGEWYGGFLWDPNYNPIINALEEALVKVHDEKFKRSVQAKINEYSRKSK